MEVVDVDLVGSVGSVGSFLCVSQVLKLNPMETYDSESSRRSWSNVDVVSDRNWT